MLTRVRELEIFCSETKDHCIKLENDNKSLLSKILDLDCEISIYKTIADGTYNQE